VGQQAVLDADHGDNGELEALGGVKGHEGDGALVGAVEGIDIGDEADAFEVGEQFFGEGGLVVVAVAVEFDGQGVFLFELLGGGNQLAEVGQAFLSGSDLSLR